MDFDPTAASLAFLLSVSFTLMLAVAWGEETCDQCDHSNYQHDEAGCSGKDVVGPSYARDCNCRGFRKAKKR